MLDGFWDELGWAVDDGLGELDNVSELELIWSVSCDFGIVGVGFICSSGDWVLFEVKIGEGGVCGTELATFREFM